MTAPPALDRQPHLVGPLLELRPLRPEDFDALSAAAADPLIWEQHPESDRWTAPVFRRYFEDAMASGGALAVIERATGQLIGSSRYHGYDPAASRVEIGWTFLARAFWGGRYNGELKRLMLEHAFRWVREVTFVIGPANLRSRKAVEKLGATYAGTTHDARGRERVVYALTPAAYNDATRR